MRAAPISRMAIFGSLKTVRTQTGRAAQFKAAFDYLVECSKPGTPAHTLLLSVELGKSERVELGGGAFALLQSYLTKPDRAAGFFESHLAYVDVQAVIFGEETIEVADVADMKISENLTPAKDMIKYEMYNKAAIVRLHGGEAAVLDPADGHMPCIAVKAATLVRKVVVKVPVAA